MFTVCLIGHTDICGLIRTMEGNNKRNTFYQRIRKILHCTSVLKETCLSKVIPSNFSSVQVL